MRTIYVDSDGNCRVSDDGTMTAVVTDFFDKKCDTFVEGFCCELRENSTAFYSKKPYSELAAAQAQYERMMAEAAAAYREGVNSAYDT